MPGSEDQPAEDHPPVAVPQQPGPPTASFAATEEARLHQQGQLEQQAHEHRTARRKHLHRIGVSAMWIVAVVGCVVGGMSLWHLVTPPCWHILPDGQVSTLNTITVTSVVSSLLTFFVQEATR